MCSKNYHCVLSEFYRWFGALCTHRFKCCSAGPKEVVETKTITHTGMKCVYIRYKPVSPSYFIRVRSFWPHNTKDFEYSRFCLSSCVIKLSSAGLSFFIWFLLAIWVNGSCTPMRRIHWNLWIKCPLIPCLILSAFPHLAATCQTPERLGWPLCCVPQKRKIDQIWPALLWVGLPFFSQKSLGT